MSSTDGFPVDDLRWEQAAVLPGCVWACLGDPAADDGQHPRTGSSAGWVWRSQFGLGFIGGMSRGPEVSVEVGRRGGVVLGARVEFTPRLAELEASGEGRWRPHGEVRCGHVVAWDEREYPDPAHQRELPLDPGAYTIDLFDLGGHALGLRLLGR